MYQKRKNLETPNPEAYWSVISNMLGKRNFDQTKELKLDDKIVVDRIDVAELLVSFFKKKVTDSTSIPALIVIAPGPVVNFNVSEFKEVLKT